MKNHASIAKRNKIEVLFSTPFFFVGVRCMATKYHPKAIVVAMQVHSIYYITSLHDRVQFNVQHKISPFFPLSLSTKHRYLTVIHVYEHFLNKYICEVFFFLQPPLHLVVILFYRIIIKNCNFCFVIFLGISHSKLFEAFDWWFTPPSYCGRSPFSTLFSCPACLILHGDREIYVGKCFSRRGNWN